MGPTLKSTEHPLSPAESMLTLVSLEPFDCEDAFHAAFPGLSPFHTLLPEPVCTLPGEQGLL